MSSLHKALREELSPANLARFKSEDIDNLAAKGFRCAADLSTVDYSRLQGPPGKPLSKQLTKLLVKTFNRTEYLSKKEDSECCLCPVTFSITGAILTTLFKPAASVVCHEASSLNFICIPSLMTQAKLTTAIDKAFNLLSSCAVFKKLITSPAECAYTAGRLYLWCQDLSIASQAALR